MAVQQINQQKESVRSTKTVGVKPGQRTRREREEGETWLEKSWDVSFSDYHSDILMYNLAGMCVMVIKINYILKLRKSDFHPLPLTDERKSLESKQRDLWRWTCDGDVLSRGIYFSLMNQGAGQYKFPQAIQCHVVPMSEVVFPERAQVCA